MFKASKTTNITTRYQVRKRFSMVFMLAIAMVGCVKPLDFRTEYIGGYVVISGSISNLLEGQSLKIGVTAELNRLPLPVNDAVAYLFDNRGSRIPYTWVGNGTYTLQDNFRGVPGDSYILEVTLSDGRTYRSIAEQIPFLNADLDANGEYKVVEKPSIEGPVTSRSIIEITGNIQLPETVPLHLRWTMDEVYIRNPTDFPDPFNAIPPPCYISGLVDPQRLVLFNGSANKSKSLTDLFLGERFVDRTFLEKHYITVYQHSISFESYDYWRKVDLLANQTGSIFDAPPAQLLGNIQCITNPSEQVYGYFEARNTILDRFHIFPSDLPIFIEPFCMYDPNKYLYMYEPECIDCLSLPNSSLIKPDWF